MAAGGIRPRAVLPVVLDVGTNNHDLLNDPLYLGMSHPRLEGEEYYSFVDEWITAITSRWPGIYIYIYKYIIALKFITFFIHRYLDSV